MQPLSPQRQGSPAALLRTVTILTPVFTLGFPFADYAWLVPSTVLQRQVPGSSLTWRQFVNIPLKEPRTELQPADATCQSKTCTSAHLSIPSHGFGAKVSQPGTASSFIQGLIQQLFLSASSMPGPEAGPGDPETKQEDPCPQQTCTLYLQSCICKVVMPTSSYFQEVSF